MNKMLDVNFDPEPGNPQHIVTLAAAVLKLLLTQTQPKVTIISSTDGLAIRGYLFELVSPKPLGGLTIEGRDGDPAGRPVAIEPAQDGEGYVSLSG